MNILSLIKNNKATNAYGIILDAEEIEDEDENVQNVYGIILDAEEIEDEDENDQIIKIKIKIGKMIYVGISLLKKDFCIIPKKGDYINIFKIELKINEFNIIKLLASGKIISNYNTIILNQQEQIIDFSRFEILNTLKGIFNIDRNIHSKIFIIEKKNGLNYVLKCINNCQNYQINIQEKELYEKDFIVINNYYCENNVIKLNKLSFIHKINDEEKLFKLFEKTCTYENRIKLCKIIEINNNGDIYLCDRFKNLYNLRKFNSCSNNNIKNVGKNKNNIQNDNKICLGQICIISNCKIISNDIILDKDSFIYFSNQNLHFSDKLLVNHYSVIQFYILDFNDIVSKNEYNKIEINGFETIIDKNIINFVVSTYKTKYYDYHPITINLINKSDKDKNKSFNFLIFQGLLNKINTFINYYEKDSYLYEFLIYNINDNLLKCNKRIFMNNIEKVLFVYDCFDSQQRIRFNVMNIPFQNYPEKKLIENNDNSFQICEIGNFNKSNILGIFSINEIQKSIPCLYENAIFDIFYEDFSEIYNQFYFCDIFNYNENQMKKLIFISKLRYRKSKIDKNISLSLNIFNTKINLIQFITRVGFIICYYINKFCNNKIKQSKVIIRSIFRVIQEIKMNENLLSLYDSLRIIFFKLRKILIEEKECRLLFFSELDNNSPYLLAKDLNIKEIENLTEQSKLFLGYLQLDCFILKNYYLDKKTSYSLSLQPIFILKYHMISNYEDFFLIDKFGEDDEFAYQSIDENLTVIKEKALFNESFTYLINDTNKSKNYAFPLCIEFKHEKGHMTRSHKNKFIDSPTLYFKNGEIGKIIYYDKNGIKGESGRLIESFIDEDRNLIKELKLVKIYGEILDYKLFIGKDFYELKKRMNEIKKKNKNNKELIFFQKFYCSDKVHKKIKSKKELINKNEENGIIKRGDIYYSKIEKENYEALKIKVNFFS